MDLDNLTFEQQVQEIEQRSRAVQAAGYAPISFFPFGDMFIEIWPGDHPFIEERMADRPGEARGDFTITALNNPFRNDGAVLGFGRACMRFLLDEQGIDDFIEFLTEAREIIHRMNDPEEPLETTSDIPISFNLNEWEFSRCQDKRFTEEQDVSELKNTSNRNLSLTEMLTREYQKAQQQDLIKEEMRNSPSRNNH